VEKFQTVFNAGESRKRFFDFFRFNAQTVSGKSGREEVHPLMDAFHA
jgi:hypothetical protein